LGTKERVKVTLSGQEHHVGIASVGTSSVTVEIASTPRNVTLAIGETKKVELTNDTIYDLAVTLNSISSGKANLTIISISEKMPESSSSSTGAATQEQPSTKPTTETKTADTKGTTSASSKTGKNTTWAIVIVVVIIVLVILFLKRRKS
jgi:LPXTG-motif cell wall-anchored protein